MINKKSLLIIFLLGIMLLLIPNISNAAVEYTRTIPGNDGSIIINLTGLTLDESKSYSFALLKKGDDPSTATWNNLVDYTSTTAKVNLSSGTKAIVDVLKVTDKGYLYIKNNSDSSYVVNAQEINLKLPYLQAISYQESSVYGTKYYDVKSIYEKIGGSGSTYIQGQKVNDKSLIQKYLDIKNNNKDITELENDLLSVPETGYSKSNNVYYSKYNDGLYLIWIKLTGENCKDIYGCIVHDGLPDAKTVSDYINGEGPKVTKIQVQSPASGTYKTGQTVKIRVYFDGEITGTTVPTLKIKFGTSAERSVTNGTIHNDGVLEAYKHYIEYSYNIKSGDNGQLATVSLTGGTIKDKDGNDAVLSCPVLTGSITIKANTEGTVTNNTENQDKTNNNTNSSNKTSTSTSTKTDKTSSSSKSDKKDTTTATGKIHYTGASYAIIFTIAIILIGGIIAKVKYNDLKGIK